MPIQSTFQALADPTRRKILKLLKKGKMSAGEICENFDISGAAISRHLNVLKEANLITDEREGKYIYYTLDISVMEEISLWISNFMGLQENEAEGESINGEEKNRKKDGERGGRYRNLGNEKGDLYEK